MTSTTKASKRHYADSFIFLKHYLSFSPTGLPIDPSTQNYYKHRIQAKDSPETISFSVFLYAVWNCFTPVIESIRLSGITIDYQPEWIPTFWGDTPIILLNPTTPTHSNNPLFSCEIFDLRGCKQPQAQALTILPKNLPAQAAIFLITDDLHPNTLLSQQTPFGIVSFFHRDEWEDYCENLV